ncbi:MAG TPA: acylphosphatase [Chlorobaculum parvum]|uniref:acylphosphatase n=1 Tax=Chlorobaculum parvum TaxID=274539 RepID=A0A7C5HC65_9CHLB|nr:acylphosphatase [Chlorobaculum parvum]
MVEKRVHIIVRGLVQGVGFRMFVHREASARSLSGWTRNLPDGTVEIEVQGIAGLVDELVRQTRIGPSRSQVNAIGVRELVVTANAETDFNIRY